MNDAPLARRADNMVAHSVASNGHVRRISRPEEHREGVAIHAATLNLVARTLGLHHVRHARPADGNHAGNLSVRRHDVNPSTRENVTLPLDDGIPLEHHAVLAAQDGCNARPRRHPVAGRDDDVAERRDQVFVRQEVDGRSLEDRVDPPIVREGRNHRPARCSRL